MKSQKLSKKTKFFAIAFLIATLVINSTAILFSDTAKAENIDIETSDTQDQSFSFYELGTKAQEKMDSDSFSIEKTEEGILLNSALQKLTGVLTQNGLTVQSNVEGKRDSFSIKSEKLYRNDGENTNILNSSGETYTKNNLAILNKGDIKEEFSTSADGIRQDFIVDERLEGRGKLNLILNVKGATVQESDKEGISLTLNNSQRKLIYHKLFVTDSNNLELPARFVVKNNNQIEIEIDDQNALYPIRIDPTITSDNWISIGGVFPGANARIFQIVFDDSDNLYIGGDFTHILGSDISYFAKWDGTSWSDLGGSPDDTVNTIVPDSDGNVYIGGRFDTVGGTPAKHIAMWNGSEWKDLDGGMGNFVLVLKLGPDDNLYAGGYFRTAGSITAERIAMWDGTSWSTFGDGFSDWTSDIAFDSAGNLYAGGGFANADGNPVNYVAMWDGASWNDLGGGVDDYVSALLFDANDNLYLGGSFTVAGGFAANRVAMWDGVLWSALGPGMNDRVRDLIFDSNGNLYAGGSFTEAGGSTANRTAKWDGASWSSLGKGINADEVLNLTFGPDGNLYAGGRFEAVNVPAGLGGAGNDPAYNIAAWNGFLWGPLEKGMNDSVYSLVFDSSGNLYAGGGFTTTPDGRANRIAMWDGTSWNALGSGLNDWVIGLTVDANDNLYAAGNFTGSGTGGLGDPIRRIDRVAMWDGSKWNDLGSRINNWAEALIFDSNGNLYVGGSFTEAGGSPGNRVAMWDGTSWSALGTGTNNWVGALAIDSNDNLYVGGDLTIAGGVPVNNIAMWDGTSWSALGTGTNDWIGALAIDSNDNLYVGGDFTEAGGSPANRVAMWDGTSWSALGDGVNDWVYALDFDADGNLFAGGDFTSAEGSPANRVAMWDGTSWSPIAYGTNKWLADIAFDSIGNMYVGGDFTVAGNKGATSVAKVKFMHNLTYTAGVNGTLTGDVSQIVKHGSNGTTVTAVANTGYHFTAWSDGIISNPRTDTNVTGDITVTANFAADPTPTAGGRRQEEMFAAVTEPEEEDPGPWCDFGDITDHWAEDYVTDLCELEYIEGYEDGTFKPDQYITRAEASKLVALWLDENIDDSYCDSTLYSDVSCDEWYGKFISYLSSVGIVEGYGEGIFSPEKNISRTEALKIMLYAKELQDTNIDDATNPFSDISVEDWYYNVVMVSYKLSIIQGYDDGTFGPNKPITRAEFVKISAETFFRTD